MIRALCLAAMLAGGAGATGAQDVESGITDPGVKSAPGATLRQLDKLTGEARDIDIAVGETRAVGGLQVTLGDCRYPRTNPSGDAYAYLVIREEGVDEPAFAGWMIASSPALNALEHPRYDIWVIRCNR